MRRARLVLCVVLALTLLVVGGMVASAGPQTRQQDTVDSLTGGGWFSPGPRLLTADQSRQPEEKIHINIRLICDPGEGNEHLRIHSNLFKFTAEDDTIVNDCNEFDDDDGMTRGEAEGTCNGQPATLSFSFSDNASFPSTDGKGPVGDTAFIMMNASEDEGDPCNVDEFSELEGGNFQYHNKGPSPTSIPPVLL